VIAPDPLPELPLGTLSHGTFGVTVHPQPVCVVSVAVTLLAGMHGLNSTGPTEYWQRLASPDWRSVNVLSATVIAAARAVVTAFRIAV
jgi:hypothetical protein